MANRALHWILRTLLVAFFCIGARASSYCYKNGQYSYCDYGCCNTWDGCCTSYTYTYSYSTYYSTAAIIGIAVGCSVVGLIIIGVIIAIICCCVRRRGSHGQVVTTSPAPPMVTTATTTNNMTLSGASGQYPLQPVGSPWYPTSQPYQQNPSQAANTPLTGPPSSEPWAPGPPPSYPPGHSEAAAQGLYGPGSSQPSLNEYKNC